MQRLIKHSAQLLWALAAIFGVAFGQQQPSTEVAALRAFVERLRAEVASLRQEVMQLQLDRHGNQVRQIKVELASVRAELTQLAERERARQQDLSDLEELLARGHPGTGEHLALEPARSDLAVSRAREIEEQLEVARARERELLHRLETEEQVVRRLKEAWKFSEEKKNEERKDVLEESWHYRARNRHTRLRGNSRGRRIANLD